MNFWQELKKNKNHVFCLAPMADVTDCAFRKLISKYGKPDVFWTEFVSADGLAHPIAREKLLVDLKYDDNEHPIVAQIFGSKKENIKEASKLCKDLGFDGIDINMGCPDKTIEKQGAGAGMIKNLALAKEIIQSAKEGGGGLPISVKTRIGYNKNEIETWIRGILEEDLAVLTVHLRTRKEMSDVPAHWDLMKRIVEIRDEVYSAKGGAGDKTLILGNGDVADIEDGKKKCVETGCDGVMLGKAIFGNPFLFAKNRGLEPGEEQTVADKLEIMVEHTQLFENMLGLNQTEGLVARTGDKPVLGKNFAIMKKHYKAYCTGFVGAKDLRMKLMDTRNSQEVEIIVREFLTKNRY